MAGASRLIDDLVRTATSAAGSVFGLRDEMEAQMRDRFERVLARADVVTREEFEVVKAVAAAARGEQEALAEKVAALETRLAALEAGPKPTKKPASRSKTRTATAKPAARPSSKSRQ